MVVVVVGQVVEHMHQTQAVGHAVVDPTQHRIGPPLTRSITVMCHMGRLAEWCGLYRSAGPAMPLWWCPRWQTPTRYGW